MSLPEIPLERFEELEKTVFGTDTGVSADVSVVSAGATPDSTPAAPADTSIDYDAIVKRIQDGDTSAIDSLTDSQVIELRKRLNPYTMTIPSQTGSLACMSIINWRDEWFKKFTMTSLIGFIYRMCEEWNVPEDQPIVPVKEVVAKRVVEYRKKLAIEDMDKKRQEIEKIKKEMDDEFDAYEHAEEEYKEQLEEIANLYGAETVSLVNKYDSIKDIQGATAEHMDDDTRHKFAAIRNAIKQKIIYENYKHNNTCYKEQIEEAIQALNKSKEAAKAVGVDPENPTYDNSPETDHRVIIWQFLNWCFHFNPDEHVRSAYVSNGKDPERRPVATADGKLARDSAKFVYKKSDLHPVDPTAVAPGDVPAPDSVRDTIATHVPPADTFHRWKYYTESNYEEILAAVRDLYCEKPDIEFMVNPYAEFVDGAKVEVRNADGTTTQKVLSAAEQAADFQTKHREEIVTDIVQLFCNKWNVMGPYKQNRERVDFYNRHTELLEAMLKQAEADKRLGASLMRKRVQKKKKESVKKVGPDHPSFEKYRRENPSAIASLGAEDISKGSRDPQMDDECPDDAIQVDVFNFRNGGQNVEVSRFYTEAEDPQEIAPSDVPRASRPPGIGPTAPL
jgi:hypothetical protein